MNLTGNSGYVYFLKAAESNLIKIGKTNNLRNRKKGIQTMSPVKLYTIGAITSNDRHKFEKELHELFAPYREHGEWFGFSRSHCAALKACLRRGGIRFDTESFTNYWKREIAKDPWI